MPPCHLDRSRHHVATVHDRGRAEHDQKVAAGRDKFGEGGRHLAFRMRAPALDLEIRRRLPASLSRRTEAVLSRTEGSRAGKHGEHERGAARAKLGDPDEPSDAPGRCRRHASRCGPLHRKRNHLDGGREAPRVDHRHRGGSVARVSSSPTAFTAATPSSSTQSTPRSRGEQIAATGERGAGDEPGGAGVEPSPALSLPRTRRPVPRRASGPRRSPRRRPGPGARSPPES